MAGAENADAMTVLSVGGIGLVLVAALLAPSGAVSAGQPQQPETDNTVTRIHVYPNGSARWTLRIRTRLETEESVEEYEAFQARFRENTSRYLDPFRTRIRGVVARAGNATGREMRAVRFTATTSIQQVPRRWGIVTFAFTWTGFAASRDGTLVVGDVFQGGFFLAANDTLEIETPRGYRIDSVSPAPDSRDGGVVTWIGREDFSDGHPRVVFAPAPYQGGPSGPGENGPGGVSWPSLGWIGPGLVLLGVLVLGLLAIGLVVRWRRREAFDRPGGAGTGGAGTGGAGTGGTKAESGGPTDGSRSPPGEPVVMTDEERVRELLEANDGRMRQAAIGEEFDWSDSKVSRVVGKLVEEGAVEKLKLGRENLIDLADDDG